MTEKIEKAEILPAPKKDAKKKEAWKPKRNPWPVLGLLGFIFALFLWGGLLLVIHPELENAIMSGKQTEQNFVASLVNEASKSAAQFPITVAITYRSVEGIDSQRDVVVFGYAVHSDGSKCAEYYYPSDPANLPTKQACVAPEKEVKHEVSWASKAFDVVTSWKGWERVADLWSK